MHTPNNRLLMLLKMHGAQSTAAAGEALGTSKENARQQLLRLANDGLVEARSLSLGVGRPQQVWSLTDAGHAQFPDTHAELTLSLIKSVRQVLGEGALEQVILARESEIQQTYAGALAGLGDIESRLAALAEERSAEGYMAEWLPAPDGQGWLFLENHCPICAAATVCQGFCRSELDIFRALLGPDFTIEREDHILNGARRCSYRILPAQP